MRLTREIRFALAKDGRDTLNSWAGCPIEDTLTPFLVLRLSLSGAVDPVTGYLCNIKEIDDLLRRWAVSYLRNQIGAETLVSAGKLLRAIPERLESKFPPGVRLSALELRLSPYLRFAVLEGGPEMVHLSESFEFSAAHRLYSPSLSDQENLRIFGKCANANGHGHNYVVDVTVAGSPDPLTGVIIDLLTFEKTVKQRVIERFDHKHLNIDCPAFAKLNPTVENITRVIWDLLQGQFGSASLSSVRVWETAKTSAEYRGE